MQLSRGTEGLESWIRAVGSLHTLTLTPHTHTYTHMHTLTRILTRTHSYTLARTHSHASSHAHTHTYTHMHILTRILHSHAHSPPRQWQAPSPRATEGDPPREGLCQGRCSSGGHPQDLCQSRWPGCCRERWPQSHSACGMQSTQTSVVTRLCPASAAFPLSPFSLIPRFNFKRDPQTQCGRCSCSGSRDKAASGIEGSWHPPSSRGACGPGSPGQGSLPALSPLSQFSCLQIGLSRAEHFPDTRLPGHEAGVFAVGFLIRVRNQMSSSAV